jgi:putative ABC transport system permease protein
MFQNYLKIALRNLQKNRFYAALNVLGLMAGILFFLLIGAYIWGETQVNHHFKNAQSQYFLTSIWKDPNLGMELTSVGPLGKQLKENYPHLVANYYRWDGITSGVSKGDKVFREGIQIGDSTLLSMFGFELLQGDPLTALNEPFSIVITEKKAKKYFNKTEVVGETLTIQNFSGGKRDFRITGVLRDLTENSVTNLTGGSDPNCLFVPTNTFNYFGRTDFDSWQNTNIPTYLELQSGVTAADLEKPIHQIVGQHGDAFLNENLTVRPVVLTDYYLQKNKGLVQRMLFTLSSVGLFILFMAILNFINLSIGRSGTRIREIGVRKVLGGLKRQLIFQFLAESFLLVTMATGLAFLVYPLTKPFFEQIVGKKIPVFATFPLIFAFFPVVLILVVGLLAGLYPALVLSSMKTVDSLKGKLGTAQESVMMRKYLVGFQFCIANLAIISAIVVAAQVNHFLGKNLGYEKEFVVTAQVPRDWTHEGVRKLLTIRDEMSRLPSVQKVSLSFEIPNGNNGGSPLIYRAAADSTSALVCQSLVTDENYLETYQIPLISGNFFDKKQREPLHVVLNESAVRALGYENAETVVGQQVRIMGIPVPFTVKGVVKDFHFGSMAAAIQPIIVFSLTDRPIYRYLSFKIRPENISESLTTLQQKWSELMPGSAFEYAFMDETLAKLYSTELQLKKSAYVATGLALLISLLGVIGLVSLNLQRRVKEVGVRKVLGASVFGIIGLFLQEFLLILMFAGIFAAPIAWYLLQKWLDNYAYHIELSYLTFAACILGMAFITTALIGVQSIKASLANPVKSLRSE